MSLFKKGVVYFSIYNLDTNEWLLDCFDYPHLFFTKTSADSYCTKYMDCNPGRFEVREYVIQ